MRGRIAVVGLLLGATVLAGCLGSSAPPEPLPFETDDGSDDPPPFTAAPPSPPPRNPPVAPPPSPPPSPEPPPFDPGPLVVIAHVDTGINPYHRAFRDPSPLAQLHPSTYLPGFPAETPELRLSLDAASYEEARQRDADLWASVQPGTLYWISGTRIVGALSFGPGGVLCPQPTVAQPALDPVPPLPGVPQEVVCPETVILDDHGHGTMTASRMAAGEHSLCPSCRIVSLEGLGPEAVRWAADQGWIDVQTNSWGSLSPTVLPGDTEVAGTATIRDAFAHAATRMLVFAASGNGLGFQGFVGEPTFQQATASAGVLQVGAHDNGRATLYHGFPPHVVADGYGGWRANARHLDEFGPSPESCCTSAASPYAAGGAAGILLEARRLVGHRGTGFPDGLGARGSATGAQDGALADGNLTLGELHRLVRLTAQPRPGEGADDGLLHWVARAPTGAVPANPQDPGENPYCVGCWALPARWLDIPAGDSDLVWLLGYGSVDPLSVDLARRLLRGEAATPERTGEDSWYEVDQAARAGLDGLP